jgi:hypothetical protein
MFDDRTWLSGAGFTSRLKNQHASEDEKESEDSEVVEGSVETLLAGGEEPIDERVHGGAPREGG